MKMDSVTTYRNGQTGGVNHEKCRCNLNPPIRKSTNILCVQYIIHKRVKTLTQNVGYDLKARMAVVIELSGNWLKSWDWLSLVHFLHGVNTQEIVGKYSPVVGKHKHSHMLKIKMRKCCYIYYIRRSTIMFFIHIKSVLKNNFIFSSFCFAIKIY